ncbi:MAG: hypothetical protein Q8Q09_24550 [Deltaproteobacteria bacterium]|nr:hypothetical protein [Deltaproteobacteria bacterium]
MNTPRAAHATLAIALALCAVGCVTREVVYVVQQPTQSTTASAQVQATATTQVQLRCEPICRQSYNACRSGCRPQSWSPNMQSIQDSCERDCDFNRFSCESECRHGGGQ